MLLDPTVIGVDKMPPTLELSLVRNPMRRLSAVVAACALIASSTLVAATGRGVLVGTAKSDFGVVLANHIVQLRTLSTGQLVSSTTSSASGEYRFANLEGGRYAIEVLNP